MRIFGIVGRSGSGKTTLIERLIPLFAARGLVVSALKGTHHDVELDKPGKDSDRFRRAGAREVILAAPRRWALIHEGDDARQPLAVLAARLSPCDLLLVEGFKSEAIDKLEVFRPALGKPPLWPDDAGIVAIAADAPPGAGAPQGLDLGDAAAIADFILRRTGL